MPVERTGKKIYARDPDDDPVEEFELDEDELASPVVTAFNGHQVTTPTGATISLMTASEADYYNEVSDRYKEDNLFTNISDLAELEKLLTFETMIHRWSTWLLQGTDYVGEPINASEVQKTMREYSKAILDVKSSLSMNKKDRDAQTGGTVAGYIATLRERAKEMGVHRAEQNYAAFNILMDIRAKITLNKNSTPTERTEFEVHAAQVLEWIESLFPEFDAIDEAFRKNQQIYWIKEVAGVEE